MEIALTIGIMVVCLIAEGFFSGSEIGVVRSDRVKLRHEAAKGSKGARLALEMLEKPEPRRPPNFPHLRPPENPPSVT